MTVPLLRGPLETEREQREKSCRRAALFLLGARERKRGAVWGRPWDWGSAAALGNGVPREKGGQVCRAGDGWPRDGGREVAWGWATFLWFLGGAGVML